MRTVLPSALPNGWKSSSEPMTKNASTAIAASATRRLPRGRRRRRAGPAGVSPGGVTIGRVGRRTRRMPIGRSVSSSSAPAGAAGGAGGRGWMRRTPSSLSAGRPRGRRPPPPAGGSGTGRGPRPDPVRDAREERRIGIGSACGGSGGVGSVGGCGAGAWCGGGVRPRRRRLAGPARLALQAGALALGGTARRPRPWSRLGVTCSSCRQIRHERYPASCSGGGRSSPACVDSHSASRCAAARESSEAAGVPGSRPAISVVKRSS